MEPGVMWRRSQASPHPCSPRTPRHVWKPLLLPSLSQVPCYAFDRELKKHDLNPLIKTSGAYLVDDSDPDTSLFINVCRDIGLRLRASGVGVGERFLRRLQCLCPGTVGFPWLREEGVHPLATSHVPCPCFPAAPADQGQRQHSSVASSLPSCPAGQRAHPVVHFQSGPWLVHSLGMGSYLSLFPNFDYLILETLIKFDSFYKSPWTQGLSVIAAPSAWSDAVSHVTSSRSAPGLESASARVSHRRGRLPGERGPRVRRGPAPGGAEAREQ